MSKIAKLLPVVMGGVKFLLRDDFNDTLAAGSVNGTLATPGGMGTAAQITRNVIDTNNKISLGSGVASFATGAVSGERIYYGLFPFVAGRVFICQFTPADTSSKDSFGWDTNTIGALIFGGLIDTASRLGVLIGGTAVYVGVYTAVPYTFAIVNKSPIGSYNFIKGGAFTNWTLLYVGGGQDDLYPAISVFGATSVFTNNFIRVPLALWLPTPLCYDTFTRVNGAIGTSEIVGPDSQVTPARTWTGTTWTIATNVAVNTPTLGAEEATGALVVGTWYSITATQANYFYTGSAIGDTFRAAATTALDANNKVKAITLATLFASQGDGATADVVVSANLVATTRMQTGIVVNLDSAVTPANAIIAYIDQDVGAGTTRILLDECVAGVCTNKITVINATYVASARLVVVRNGTSVRVFYNNLAVGAVTTLTANTNTLHGLFSTSASNTFNDFLVMPRGVNGEYNSLDRFTKGG